MKALHSAVLGAAVALAMHVAPAAAGPIPFHGQTYFGNNDSVFGIKFFDPDGLDGHGGYFGSNQGGGFGGSNSFDALDNQGPGSLPSSGEGGGSNGQGGGDGTSNGAGNSGGAGGQGYSSQFVYSGDLGGGPGDGLGGGDQDWHGGGDEWQGGNYGSQGFTLLAVNQINQVPGPGALLLLGLGVSGIAVAVARKGRR